MLSSFGCGSGIKGLEADSFFWLETQPDDYRYGCPLFS
jgi:hypothetical protein